MKRLERLSKSVKKKLNGIAEKCLLSLRVKFTRRESN